MDPQMAQMTTETALPDSITCGQCAQKYYHVSSFLKHKANCDKLNNNLDKKEASSSSEGNLYILIFNPIILCFPYKYSHLYRVQGEIHIFF